MGECLSEYVRLSAIWLTKDDDGESRSDRARRFGRNQSVPEIERPDGSEHLTEWFWSLNAARQTGMNGPLPLPFSEIQAWLTLFGEIATREEIAILRKMDAAFLAGRDEWRVWHESVTEKKGK